MNVNHKKLLTSWVFLLAFFCLNGQADSVRLANLIQHTNELVLYPYAQGIFQTPFGMKDRHRDFSIRNIALVDSFRQTTTRATKKSTAQFVVKDNLTITQNPDDRFNSRTDIYREDGHRTMSLRGSHPNDLYKYDKKGYLVQYGYGGELRKAKRKGMAVEWHNVKKGRLDFINTFNENGRLVNLKSMGHLYGGSMDYVLEEYQWDGDKLMASTMTRKFTAGRAEVISLKYSYDDLGLLNSVEMKMNYDSEWNSSPFSTQINHLENDHTQIVFTMNENTMFSITFDQYDNWVEMNRGGTQLSTREITYRVEERGR